MFKIPMGFLAMRSRHGWLSLKEIFSQLIFSFSYSSWKQQKIEGESDGGETREKEMMASLEEF